jgi:2-haloacid dehalogenase
MDTKTLDQLRDSIEIVTFDCYGTLVDWKTGVQTAIREAGGACDPALFDAYLRAEADIELQPYRCYREVLASVLERLSARFGFDLPQSRRYLLAETLSDWPLWPDTVDALRRIKTRYRIGVLSNVDRDLFAGTAEKLGVSIDLLVTAEDVRKYKPSSRHFVRMLAEIGGDRTSVLHAAQSLYHDCIPATQLGITNVWINRQNETNTTRAKPVATLPDMASLADALGV